MAFALTCSLDGFDLSPTLTLISQFSSWSKMVSCTMANHKLGRNISGLVKHSSSASFSSEYLQVLTQLFRFHAYSGL